eukprot:jgi/Bigna1/142893/aug1.73_g17601
MDADCREYGLHEFIQIGICLNSTGVGTALIRKFGFMIFCRKSYKWSSVDVLLGKVDAGSEDINRYPWVAVICEGEKGDPSSNNDDKKDKEQGDHNKKNNDGDDDDASLLGAHYAGIERGRCRKFRSTFGGERVQGYLYCEIDDR